MGHLHVYIALISQKLLIMKTYGALGWVSVTAQYSCFPAA